MQDGKRKFRNPNPEYSHKDIDELARKDKACTKTELYLPLLSGKGCCVEYTGQNRIYRHVLIIARPETASDFKNAKFISGRSETHAFHFRFFEVVYEKNKIHVLTLQMKIKTSKYKDQKCL